MATSFGTAIPTTVIYRVLRDGDSPFVRVRVFIGEATPNAVGALKMLPAEYKAWRATLRDYDPARFSVFYADGVFEWLHSSASAGGA